MNMIIYNNVSYFFTKVKFVFAKTKMEVSRC